MLEELSRPLNILVIGLPGSGKSTFISNTEFAITDDYKEVAAAGVINSGDSFTIHYRKHTITKHAKLANRPVHLLDFPGLVNKEQDGLIRCLLEGRIPIGKQVIQDGASYEHLQKAYPNIRDDNVIDRVAFIHPATVELPDHICSAIMDETRQKGRVWNNDRGICHSWNQNWRGRQS